MYVMIRLNFTDYKLENETIPALKKVTKNGGKPLSCSK